VKIQLYSCSNSQCGEIFGFCTYFAQLSTKLKKTDIKDCFRQERSRNIRILQNWLHTTKNPQQQSCVNEYVYFTEQLASVPNYY